MDNLPAQDNIIKPKLKSFFGTKIVFVVLGMVILVELIYAVKALTVPVTPLPVRNISNQKPVAKISLMTAKTNLKVNDIVPVSVVLNSGQHSLGGVDLIVRYDPKILDATPAGIIKGKIFDEYPLISVDKVKGIISISGISSLKNGFTGTGDFATINLRAKLPGKTSLIVDFTKGSTTDSNLVDLSTSQDVLESIDNLELNIQ